MRIIHLPAASIAAAVLALTLGGALSPAEAGALCNRADLDSPCVSNSDLKANVVLGGNTGNGRLRLRNEDGDIGLELRSDTANVINLFSNDEDESNGLVKAWAQINADGTIVACWRCNTDAAETRRLSAGNYEIDFTPLATDVTGRPRTATIDVHIADSTPSSFIDLADRSGDPSSVFVNTTDTAATSTDAPFVLIIY
jgi:hypothetical protein